MLTPVWRRALLLYVVLGLAIGFFYLALNLGSQALQVLGASVQVDTASGLQAFTVRAGAIGLLVMALIQVVRGVLPIRGHFHEHQVGRWLRDGVEKGEKARCWKPVPLDDLVELGAIRDRRQLFDLPLEQLCGQIGATAEQVVADPCRWALLLEGLAGADKAKDYIKVWEKTKPGAGQVGNESEESPTPALEPSSHSEGRSKDMWDLGEARNRIGLAIQRNIDAFQVSVGVRWKRSLRVTALGLSAALAFGMIWPDQSAPPGTEEPNVAERAGFTTTGGFSSGRGVPATAAPVGGVAAEGEPAQDPAGDRDGVLAKLFELVMTSVAAGFLATVSRDVVAVVERYRG